MIKAFKEAIESGHVQPVVWPDGKPFVVDGVTYYQANNSGIDMAMGRFHSLGDMLRKHDSLKLSDEMLTTAIATMKDQIRTAMATLGEDPEGAEETIRYALTSIERMQQRREFGMDIAQVYDLAAIWFFGEQEDPAVIDPELNRQKIAAWMQHPELYAFFFEHAAQPFRTLSAACQRRYPELYQQSESTGTVGLEDHPAQVSAIWTDARYDTHYRIASGDPARLDWFDRCTVEKYHNYIAGWIRDERRKAKEIEQAIAKQNRSQSSLEE